MNLTEVQAEFLSAKKLKGPLGLKLTQLLKQKLQLLETITTLDKRTAQLLKQKTQLTQATRRLDQQQAQLKAKLEQEKGKLPRTKLT